MKINMVRNNILEKSILEAAERLFLEKGFAHTTTTMIAREVGCNQSLIHYYFRSKEKLFQLVFEKNLQIFTVGLSTIANNSLTFEERIKDCVYTQFEMLQDHPEIVSFLINELTTNPKNTSAVKKQLMTISLDLLQIFERDLQIEIFKGRIHQISAIDLIMNIFSLNTGVFLFYSIAKKLSIFTDVKLQELIALRKEENLKIILKSVLIS